MIILAGAAYAASSPDQSDRQFVITVAKTDMVQAHEGQIAEDQASRARVKDFAKTVVQDNTDSYGQLSMLAGKLGLPIPRGIDAAKQPAIERLTRLKGASFERQFATNEVEEYRRVIATFKHEAGHGTRSELKAYASKMIPTLEKDLHLAEECLKSAGRG